MKSKFKRLGDYIRLIDVRNRDGAIGPDRLLGININKEFMPSVANVSETDLTKYKVIRKGQFAYSAMQVGRDETVRVSLYVREYPVIISPAYLVFEVTDEQVVFPEFLMMWFHRQESDRYGWFISDSSVRASLEWERFCDIRIPIPGIDEQRKYVALYNALVKNQQAYEKSLADLQLICDSFLEDLKNKLPHARLGQYIEPINTRNTFEHSVAVQGVSNQRMFVQTKANMNGVSLTNYKIVRRGDFAYNPSRLNIGSIALRSAQDCIVSPMYVVFSITKPKALLLSLIHI